MADMPETGPKRLEIRKYPNRRYYNSTRSRHVTLEEIYALIRDGYEVRITDSKTDQDITAKVLGQIIVESDPPKLGAFPVPLLHLLLRSNEVLVNDFMQRYNQALSAFLDSQRSAEQNLRSAMGMPSPTPTTPASPAAAEPPPVPSQEPPHTAPTQENHQSDVRQVVNELRQEIAQLHEELGRMRKERSSGRSK